MRFVSLKEFGKQITDDPNLSSLFTEIDNQ